MLGRSGCSPAPPLGYGKRRHSESVSASESALHGGAELVRFHEPA